MFQIRAVHRGGQQGQLSPPPEKITLAILFYFKYVGQDKSCLIFKYIGALSSFAPPGKEILRTALFQIFTIHSSFVLFKKTIFQNFPREHAPDPPPPSWSCPPPQNF